MAVVVGAAALWMLAHVAPPRRRGTRRSRLAKVPVECGTEECGADNLPLSLYAG